MFFIAPKSHAVEGASPLLDILEYLRKLLVLFPLIQYGMVASVDLRKLDEVISS